ncbi:hypothetical protein GGR54DRAFT_585354 [Hypoxylon sp. NC1633]|nr:hypothetical protein GGR54DRAFT_585354 [Hypoxylon sp. NC1633]
MTSLLDRVHQWQVGVISQEHEAEPYHDEILADLYNSGRDLYQAFMQDLEDDHGISKSLYRQLESGYTYYVIWAHDHGAKSGELDRCLQKSQKLRRFTIKLLDNIWTILQKARSLLSSTNIETKSRNIDKASGKATEKGSDSAHSNLRGADNGSETSDDEYFDAQSESLKDLAETLLDEIENLLDLGPRLDEPVPDVESTPAEGSAPDNLIEEQAAAPSTTAQYWDPVRYFTDRVLTKFPECDSNLAVALGKANWASMTRLQEKRESALNHGPNKPISADNTTLPKDSGLGSSLPSTRPYEETIVSYYGDGMTRTKIPPLPDDIEIGQLFSCIACGENIEKRDMRTWKRHLLADLQPWICCQTSCKCDRVPFANREGWVEHLRRQHALHPEWDDKTCPLCSEVVVGGGHSTISHIAHHLEEVSLAVLPRSPKDSDGDEDTSTSLSIVSLQPNTSGIGNLDADSEEIVSQPPQRAPSPSLRSPPRTYRRPQYKQKQEQEND